MSVQPYFPLLDYAKQPQEMDQLLERGGITDEQYGNFIDLLPAEASLRNLSTPIPATNNSLPNLGSLSLLDRQPSHTPTPASENPPPAYANPIPPPPARNDEPPELCRVVALYRYQDADPRDCDFEVGDQISVTSYANNGTCPQNIFPGQKETANKRYHRMVDW